ncbi:CbaC protein [Natrinema altunense]|uniref:CbaC protein n=1 Tax=Natrinema altunense TaxID=222984 RepID=A0A482Y4D8_9EURY|nr:CbaC protein [Natrinema altunense]RZH69293.1 CbaC protein [Natrinema altunense]
MRISKGALLVVIAVLVPFVVEFRTALSWFGIELSILESLVLGCAAVLAVVLWAVWPPNGNAEAELSGSS